MSNDDLETPDRILDAAEELFAHQGFKATTIKQIGSAAGLNPALIYYYFGSKGELYRRLLTRMLTTIAGQGAERLGAAPSPEAAVRALGGVQAGGPGGHPGTPRLLTRVLTTRAGQGAERLGAAPSPEAAVRALVGLQSEVLSGHPGIPRLMARETADHGAAHAQEGGTQTPTAA